MSLNCILKVGEKTRPVKDFLHNDDRYYTAVKAHLRECGTCDPEEALRGFLSSRRKTYGLTSTTLCKMAESYERTFSGKVPKCLIDEFFIRGMLNWEFFAERIQVLTEADVVKAHSLIIEARRALIKDTLPKLEEAIRKRDERGTLKFFDAPNLRPFHHLQRQVHNYCHGNIHRKPHWRIKSWMYEDPRFKLAVSLIEGSSDDIDPDEKDPDIIRFLNLQRVYLIMKS
jgi:hypothetical protein